MKMNDMNGYGSKHANGTDYAIEEHSLGDPRHLRIVTIGAGAAGLNMARHLELHMKNFEHVIYEKNSDVGGTWFENRSVHALEPILSRS
jgi:ribulose 1,5-bisphosphate synthetase/thiazole synthase